MTIETIHWHTLHPRYLGPTSNVLDLGANIGQFATAITERFGCSCVAVEPSPTPFSIIPTTPLISKLQAAVGGSSGVMPFHAASELTAGSLLKKSASYTETLDVQVLTLPQLLQRLAWERVDLLKVDIEGAEIGMFEACSDETLKKLAQISIEFHDFCGLTPGAEVRKTLARFHRLDFYSVRMSRVGHQDTWLVNRRRIDISRAELLFIKSAVRNWMGLKRVMKRHFSRKSPNLDRFSRNLLESGYSVPR